MAWLSSYTYNGHTYNRGDSIWVKGECWGGTTSSHASNGQADFTERAFYGYYEGGAHPLGISTDASSAASGSVRYCMNMEGLVVTIVRFHRNTSSSDATTATVMYRYGTSGQAFTNNGWSRNGYDLSGWSESQNATTATYATTSGVNNDWIYNNDNGEKGIDLYAVWTAKSYKVTFDANGGSVSNASKSVTYNSTYGTLPTPTRSGYTFNGWYTAASGGSRVISTNTVNITSNQTLYAQWTEHYLTINYYSNNATAYGGTSEYPALNTVNNNNVLVFTKEYKYNGTHNNGLLNYKEEGSSLYMYRTGYTATGQWGTSTSGGTLVDQGDETLNTGQKIAQKFGKDLTSGNASINVYAQWQANTYTIAYNGNGHTGGSTSSSTHTYNSSKALTANGFTKIGYSFIGWAESASGSVKYTDKQSVSNLTSTNGATVTLYAKWQANTYTVNFNANGGTASTASKTVTYDSTYGTLATATRTGYKFLGWYTAKSGGTQITSSTKVSITATQTLYAQWEPMNVAYYKRNGQYVLCNTYGKVDGTWQPMLLYGKINGAWVRSVTDE